MLAGRGRHTDADGAFVRASKLAPGDFEPFLRDWWIVGPFPFELRVWRPRRIGPTPRARSPRHRPRALAADPGRSPRLGRSRQVFLAVGADLRLCLDVLWAPEERDLTITLAADDFVRVWLNSKLVYEHARGPALEATRLPNLILQPGRNTLLIKVANDRIGFTFRVVPLLSRPRGKRFGHAPQSGNMGSLG